MEPKIPSCREQGIGAGRKASRRLGGSLGMAAVTAYISKAGYSQVDISTQPGRAFRDTHFVNERRSPAEQQYLVE